LASLFIYQLSLILVFLFPFLFPLCAPSWLFHERHS
jgi:hypothetical protein